MLYRRKLAFDQAHLLLSLKTLLANLLPAGVIAALVASDILRQGVQRKVRCDEGHIGEERLLRVLFGMLLQATNREIRDGRRGIVARAWLHRGKFLIVFKMHLRAEEATAILQVVRAVEASFERHAIDVPLAAVIRAI